MVSRMDPIHAAILSSFLNPQSRHNPLPLSAFHLSIFLFAIFLSTSAREGASSRGPALKKIFKKRAFSPSRFFAWVKM